MADACKLMKLVRCSMENKLKAFGILMAPFSIVLSSITVAIAGDESAIKYCHGATDFIGCMKAERDGSLVELRRLKGELKTTKTGSVWLVLYQFGPGPHSALKVEMKDMDQCEEQGVVFTSSKRLRFGIRVYECLEGK